MLTRPIHPNTILLAVVLTGCASQRNGRETVTAARTPVVACAQGTGLPQELREPGSVVLFGETHGTQELPAFFGEAVCTTASSGLPVEVGIELPSADQGALDAFLASPGGRADVEALIATPFWTRDTQDGRSSQAMLALLERVRQLRAAGLTIHAFSFDLSANGAEHEQGMAENIASHTKAHPEALAMVLVGEVHSWKEKGAPWDPKFLPMGWYVREAGIRVRSLGRSTPAGTQWSCLGKSMADLKCEASTTPARNPSPSGRATGIEILPEPSKEGFDGLFVTPSITSSPPAVSPPGTHP
jgi:hypothetical protein